MKEEKFKPKTCSLLIEGIPENVRIGFKAATYKNGKSMKQVLISFMKWYAKTKG